ncbi:hypothetical protein B0H67DRAFT_321331 [Lasiosphaeris hirsuta]|uniref:Uncharacterized protein n=1 Tax=Lasiosphaeris hirsuta TaxID=260670 RepID=A0AA40DPX5_9PEZI|nr:hypothetical protein B0H67DRAFT_321331 [Lasiosphaeris hirsuta]
MPRLQPTPAAHKTPERRPEQMLIRQLRGSTPSETAAPEHAPRSCPGKPPPQILAIARTRRNCPAPPLPVPSSDDLVSDRYQLV